MQIKWDDNNTYISNGSFEHWKYKGKISKLVNSDDNLYRAFLYDETCENKLFPKKKYINMGSFESLKDIEKFLENMCKGNNTPQAGDFILFNTKQWYARGIGDMARIESVIDDNTRVQVCCGHPSSFHVLNRGYSFSGGPFESIRLSDLILTTATQKCVSWNWGTNGSGAGHAVEYFEYKRIWLLNNITKGDE